MQKTGACNDYRREVKQRILELAMEEFLSVGVRAVKMDYIAQKLGISKRTLYEIYNNKEDLLLEGLMLKHDQQDKVMHDFMAEGHNVMEVLAFFMSRHMAFTSAFNPVLFEDIQKYDKVRTYLEEKHDQRKEKSIEFFMTGVKEGFFRDDVDYKLVLEISGITAQRIMNQHMYAKYPLPHLFRTVVFLYLRGFCTQKGIEMLDKYLKI